MKVSVITMTSTYNYGATLQAYALQEYVNSLGHSCNVIDHMGWTGHRTVSLKEITKDALLQYPYRKRLEVGYRNFEKFYADYMLMTKRYDTYEALANDPPPTDAFITGSDQVWNPRDPKYAKFFLEFVPKGIKRLSYAASLGDSLIPEEKQAYYIEQLNAFDGISTRETQGQELLAALTQKKVHRNCDPVYLINREKWRSLEYPPQDAPDDYILCYMINKPEWLNRWLKDVKIKTGKRIVFIGLQGIQKVHCDQFIRTAGPREFLWLIDHASGVITSSFHGAAFTILFGKPFIAIPDQSRPERIRNLLRVFGLESREVREMADFKQMEVYAYDGIEEKIREERNSAKNYLQSVLS